MSVSTIVMIAYYICYDYTYEFRRLGLVFWFCCACSMFVFHGIAISYNYTLCFVSRTHIRSKHTRCRAATSKVGAGNGVVESGRGHYIANARTTGGSYLVDHCAPHPVAVGHRRLVSACAMNRAGASARMHARAAYMCAAQESTIVSIAR